MKNQVTFGHLLTVVSILIIPLLLWGVSVEKHMTNSVQRDKEILMLQREVEKMQTEARDYQRKSNNDYFNILEKLHSIDLKVSKIQ